jgi:hypothetical protein
LDANLGHVLERERAFSGIALENQLDQRHYSDLLLEQRAIVAE